MDPTQSGRPQIGLFALADRRLAWLGARQGVLAQNVANADTPGWQQRDIRPFSDVLSGSVSAAASAIDAIAFLNIALLPVSCFVCMALAGRTLERRSCSARYDTPIACAREGWTQGVGGAFCCDIASGRTALADAAAMAHFGACTNVLWRDGSNQRQGGPS